MIWLNFERAFEIGLGAVEIAVVEKGFAEEKRELVIVAIESEGLFESFQAAIGIECVDGRFGLDDESDETVALLAPEQRHDAIAPLREALLLFESEHLLAHL